MKRSAAASPAILLSFMGRVTGDRNALGRLTRERLREFACKLKLNASHELSVVLCDSPTIRRVNRRWRGKDKPTDVLSFPQQIVVAGKPAPPGPLGDIMISLPVARRAARELGLEFADHFSHLLLHGLLHLLGYDHIRERDARAMESLERHILRHL